MKTIKDYEYEHLKCVAKRNADLYKFYPDEFENKMLSYGWKQSDIELMKKYIKKRENITDEQIGEKET